MNPSPQENQPGEAKRYSVAFIRSVYPHKLPPELYGATALVLESELIAERAKRLELEQELFEARQAILREGLRSAGIERERDELRACLNGRDAIQDPMEARILQLEAELLALRGGKVGQTDLVRTEAKAGGETRPGSASFAPETVKMWMMSTGALVPASGEAKQGDFNPHVLVSVVILGPNVEGTAKASVQSESGAPSPEPAAISKTTSAREWWILPANEENGWHEVDEILDYKPVAPRFIHVREVGEGRKVSPEALSLMEQIIDEHTLSPAKKHRLPVLRELLCVLSEEGGRQKEGGTQIQIPNA